MDILIRPKKLKGTLPIIPSKSYSHRAIIAASLSEGFSVIKNVLFSEDIKRTIEACEAFGATINRYDDYLEIEGAAGVKRVKDVINAGESGSTIRFMIPILLTTPEKMTFKGMNHLVKRPLDVYLDIFNKQGIKYVKGENYLPLETNGGFSSGVFDIPGDISSQFITGLLFALPLLNGDSKINIIGKLESKAYVDLTLDILKRFGIVIDNHEYLSFSIKGQQTYKACDYTIEGDYSQAAFFLAMGALGNDVKLACMNLESLQGDRKILQDLQDLNGCIYYEDDLLYAKADSLKGNVIDFAQSPDLGPVLSVVAAVSNGETKFINAQRLRIKECDRISCMRIELNKLGAKVSESESEMYFDGVNGFGGSLELDCHNDHRIAMSLAVASTVCRTNLLLKGAECVKKSYPHFWSDFKKLGGDFDVID